MIRNGLHFCCKKFEELNLNELYNILKVRQEVFIVEQNCPYLDADHKDVESYHLMGKDMHGDILAYSRLLPTGVSYPDYASIGRVLTSRKVRRNGWGWELMRQSLMYMEKLFPYQPIKISAQVYLLEFYSQAGFKETGKYYPEDGIPHAEMIFDPSHSPK